MRHDMEIHTPPFGAICVEYNVNTYHEQQCPKSAANPMYRYTPVRSKVDHQWFSYPKNVNNGATID